MKRARPVLLKALAMNLVIIATLAVGMWGRVRSRLGAAGRGARN